MNAEKIKGETMKTTKWEWIFGLGIILFIAGGASLPFNLFGTPWPSYALVSFGLVLVGAGLSIRQRNV
jgi:hypothetical protein